MKFKKRLKCMILFLYRIMTKIFQVRKDVIIFESNLGRNCLGNPKAIYDEMVRQGLDRGYHCYYILDDPAKTIINGAGKKIKNSRLSYYYIMAIAGIWINDTRFQNYIIKRKGVTYIQTWHGTPLKKLALDMERVEMAETTNIREYHQEFRKNTATWDYLISQNKFSTETFRRAFAFHGEILEIGYPRNDILFYGNTYQDRILLKEKYKIPEDKEVMLYAPTWRDDAYYDKANYKFETRLDFARMKEAFSKDYILIVKSHYMVKNDLDWKKYDGFVIPMKAEVEIAELYLISDLLITDYSSVMFDYSILRRPMFFYVYDYDNYRDQLRGFYFDLIKEAPGPVVIDTIELIQAIHEYNPMDFEEAYHKFCEKYNSFDDGQASKKVVELIKSLDV